MMLPPVSQYQSCYNLLIHWNQEAQVCLPNFESSTAVENCLLPSPGCLFYYESRNALYHTGNTNDFYVSMTNSSYPGIGNRQELYWLYSMSVWQRCSRSVTLLLQHDLVALFKSETELEIVKNLLYSKSMTCSQGLKPSMPYSKGGSIYPCSEGWQMQLSSRVIASVTASTMQT